MHCPKVGQEKIGIGERINSLPVQPEAVQDPYAGVAVKSNVVDDPVTALTLVSVADMRLQDGNLSRM